MYDPPLEGPENGALTGMKYDVKVNGTQTVAIRNGKTIVKTYSPNQNNQTIVRLAFYRVEQDGSETLLANEYSPLKSINRAITRGKTEATTSLQRSRSVRRPMSRSMALELSRITS
ncbi:Alpha-xylosidase A [Fulvia fulva]|uniref:Alpha-xylosidase A n=1 Tax=Passalora fulva TaxID=5499 RepID=A0A9Q8LIV9_PASFU|nr:Alpha-xylosidase A [Fulvia fulva]KAK4623768.1 Alpha-xylosidase A [Fulvia fulva]KAK4625586.1 Alpha-xylosidase A [Fulvia fulva]UJO17949.1 Alpha-xylosidase A [Fulvia fulva]WPV15377.1 Alpha-xylosidase A [Fulvia fulva]WPV30057.1 Alpha-xylosidase A [Fulvia fulva]